MLAMIVLQSATLTALGERGRSLLSEAGWGALDLLLALAVVVLGWAIARAVSELVMLVLRAAKFNEGVRGLIGKTAESTRSEPARLVSQVVFWGLFSLAAMLAADALGFDLATSVGSRLRDVLPRVVAAAIELVVGIALAMALGDVARRVFESAGVRRSRLRGQIVSGVLGAFAVLVALEQLGLAAQFIVALGITTTAAVGLAAALAFGLGCRDLVRDFVVEYLRSLDDGPSGRPE